MGKVGEKGIKKLAMVPIWFFTRTHSGLNKMTFLTIIDKIYTLFISYVLKIGRFRFYLRFVFKFVFFFAFFRSKTTLFIMQKCIILLFLYLSQNSFHRIDYNDNTIGFRS